MTQRKRFHQPLPHGIRQPPLMAVPQTLVFDAEESQQRQATGANAALWAALPWVVRATIWLENRETPFTSEALVADIGLPNGVVGTNRNNAVGALIRAWARQKAIKRTGYTASKRVESHGALLSIWIRSELQGDAA